jgi:energy-coupling factor transporter ATP-binding protein EcfA2
MAELLLARAHIEQGYAKWSFVEEYDISSIIHVVNTPTDQINDGDVWHVELVSSEKDKKQRKSVSVRLISKKSELADWQKIKELPDHWTNPTTLKQLLIWLNTGTPVILAGDKGCGKTTLGYAVVRALHWQAPCKVDVETIKHGNDMFGSDAAQNGSTKYIKSAFADYLERAIIAHSMGLDTHFLVILDEINRIHEKSHQGMHGLFDDTKQVTITTSEGSVTITLPPNVHFIGTMNIGPQHQDVFMLGTALQDRFGFIWVDPMPEDYEVKKLVQETGIQERSALQIIQVARAIRELARSGAISYAPSYRGCRNTARLLQGGFPNKLSLVRGLLDKYASDITVSGKDIDAKPGTEAAKALAALTMKGA